MSLADRLERAKSAASHHRGEAERLLAGHTTANDILDREGSLTPDDHVALAEALTKAGVHATMALGAEVGVIRFLIEGAVDLAVNAASSIAETITDTDQTPGSTL